MSRRIVGAAAGVAFVLSMTIGLMGCGTSDSDAPAAAGSTHAKPAVSPPGNEGGQDMVAAVSGSKAPGAVDVRFALSGRPAVGTPLDIHIALIPNIELERMYARFQAGEGLELVKGAESERFERPAKGAAKRHTMTITPRNDGIFYVTAVVVADSATESVARNFSIPIIAGAGLPELPAPTPPVTGATRP